MDSPQPKKSLGQHWLNDKDVLEAIVAAADIGPGSTVLEIGPGPGALTGVLAEKAGHLVAVELDNKLAASLAKKFPNIDVINTDILKYDLTGLPAGYKIVANIPYYLTSHLIRLVSETANPPATAALLVQKEVAERVASKPGEMSLLSVTAQFYWKVELDKVVPAVLFEPPPKVDSQILLLHALKTPLFPDVDPKTFFRLVKAGFSQRRKTLLNALSAGLSLDKAIVARLCETAGIDAKRRAQTLSLKEWHELYLALPTK